MQSSWRRAWPPPAACAAACGLDSGRERARAAAAAVRACVGACARRGAAADGRLRVACARRRGRGAACAAAGVPRRARGPRPLARTKRGGVCARRAAAGLARVLGRGRPPCACLPPLKGSTACVANAHMHMLIALPCPLRTLVRAAFDVAPASEVRLVNAAARPGPRPPDNVNTIGSVHWGRGLSTGQHGTARHGACGSLVVRDCLIFLSLSFLSQSPPHAICVSTCVLLW